MSWDASTDNVGVTGYRVLRNLAEVVVVPGAETATNLDLGAGSHWIQVQALDAAGNESFRTPPVNVVVVIAGADTTPPSTPGNVTAAAQPDGSILVTWTPSSDDVGVDSYRILRNLAEVGLVDGAENQDGRRRPRGWEPLHAGAGARRRRQRVVPLASGARHHLIGGHETPASARLLSVRSRIAIETERV